MSVEQFTVSEMLDKLNTVEFGSLRPAAFYFTKAFYGGDPEAVGVMAAVLIEGLEKVFGPGFMDGVKIGLGLNAK